MHHLCPPLMPFRLLSLLQQPPLSLMLLPCSDAAPIFASCHARCAALRGIRDDIEKEHAFLGLCALLRLNPQVGGIHAT